MKTKARRPAGAAADRAQGINLRRALLPAAGLYLLWAFAAAIVRVLLLFFLAFLGAAILNVPIRWLAARGVPRGVSAAIIALIVFGAAGTVVYFAGPPLAEQAVAVVQSGPQRLQRLQRRVDALARRYPALRPVIAGSDSGSIGLMNRLSSVLPMIGRCGLRFLGGIAAALIVFVLALYMAASPRPLLRGVVAAVPAGLRGRTVRALTRVVAQTESWALATLALMAIVGTASGLGLWALGVSNPVLFGLIAGLGEAVPTVGPIVSALPPMAVALADDPIKALWVALLFLGVQQVENNLLVPVIMGRGVKLQPVSILFFVLALGSLLGILGALLAVPSAIVAKTVWEEFYLEGRRPDPEALERDVTRVLGAGEDSE